MHLFSFFFSGRSNSDKSESWRVEVYSLPTEECQGSVTEWARGTGEHRRSPRNRFRSGGLTPDRPAVRRCFGPLSALLYDTICSRLFYVFYFLSFLFFRFVASAVGVLYRTSVRCLLNRNFEQAF